jgi:hypothetical protein
MVYLLLLHMLLAVALLGAVTHQTLGVLVPVRKGPRNFFARFRAVDGTGYVNAIVILFVVTAVLGFIIYPNYRLFARVYMEELRMYARVGSFELKEHLIALGLGLLPAYWWVWQPAQQERVQTRRVLTAMLAVLVWYGFMVGHLLNNTRGISF